MKSSIFIFASIAFFSVTVLAGEEAVKDAPPKPLVSLTGVKPVASPKVYSKPSDTELAKKLTPIQLYVTQKSGTEPPFKNEFWDNHETGLFVDVVTGEPLFSSRDKFNSGTGWPSFTKPIEESRVKNLSDSTHGMERVEVRSKAGDSHLGHVFDDGPKPSGKRYCINSASLRFIPLNKLEEEGYGQYKGLIEGTSTTVADATNNSCAIPKKGEAPGCNQTIEAATLSGGCFWGMQDLLRKIPGVISTEVGYAGGTTDKPAYTDVKTGATGHAESVQVTFDRTKLTYADLLEKWFFRMHDPTTANRQGNDIGTQYRSAIFYETDEQAKVAAEVKERMSKSGKWPKPIVTEIVKAGKFTRAEDHHQDYLVKNPGGYTCHFLRDWKDEKTTVEKK